VAEPEAVAVDGVEEDKYKQRELRLMRLLPCLKSPNLEGVAVVVAKLMWVLMPL